MQKATGIMAKLLVTLLLSSFVYYGEGIPIKDKPAGFGTAEYVLIIGCDGFGELDSRSSKTASIVIVFL